MHVSRSCRPRKASLRTSKGSPKKKLKTTSASPEFTQPDSTTQPTEAEYLPSPLKARPKRSARVTRSRSTPLTQTQDDDEEEGEGSAGAKRPRPVCSRHSRLVRLGSATSDTGASSPGAARSRSPVGKGADSDSASDSDSDGAITVGARTPRRGGAQSRKKRPEVVESDPIVHKSSESSPKKAKKDDFEGKDDRIAGSLAPEDNSDILFDGVSREIVVPKDLVVSTQPDAGDNAAAADLDDLDARIDRERRRKSKNVPSSRSRGPVSSPNRLLTEHLDKRFSSPRHHPNDAGTLKPVRARALFMPCDSAVFCINPCARRGAWRNLRHWGKSYRISGC